METYLTCGIGHHEFLKKEERLNVELAHGHYDNFLIVKKNGLPMNCRSYRTALQTISSQTKEKLLICINGIGTATEVSRDYE